MSADDVWRFVLSLSVAFPAVAGIIRFKKIDSSYAPLLIYFFVSLVNELIMGILIVPNNKRIVVLNWTLFNLFESIILLVQFYYWKRFDRYKKIFPILLGLDIGIWVIEDLFVYDIYHFNIFFLISYSFVLVLLSVQTINYIIVNEGRVPLTKNPKFIICTTMIIFFIYNIFVYTLMAKGVKVYNKAFMGKIFAIQVYVNVFANILYGIAVCLMPQKMESKAVFKDFGNE